MKRRAVVPGGHESPGCLALIFDDRNSLEPQAEQAKRPRANTWEWLVGRAPPNRRRPAPLIAPKLSNPKSCSRVEQGLL